MIEVKEYKWEHACELANDWGKVQEAQYNAKGPAKSVYLNGKLIACGGIRVTVLESAEGRTPNMGEVWMIIKHPVKSSYTKAFLRVWRTELLKMMKEGDVHGLWAIGDKSANLLKRLGFEHGSFWIWNGKTLQP